MSTITTPSRPPVPEGSAREGTAREGSAGAGTVPAGSGAVSLGAADGLVPAGAGRTYEVRTFGCQMNVHDSERLSGSLEAAGYVRADGDQADVVVINTCAVRENADNKLYGNLGQLASIKRTHEGMQIAVGGCLAQKDKNVILEKAPWVDVVFGTHNMGSLPSLL